jgi:hypothetical protein
LNLPLFSGGFFLLLAHLTWLLISAPGACGSRAVRGASSALCACGVSPAPSSRRSLRAFRSNQPGNKINNTL